MTAIFSATDIRGTLGDDLTIEYIWDIGKAFADWLAGVGPVVVMRGSSVDESTVHALTEGVLLQGRSVIDAGASDDSQQLTTAIMDKQAAGGVLIEYQSTQNLVVIMLFDDRGVGILDSTGLQEITQLVEAGNFLPAAEKGERVTL